VLRSKAVSSVAKYHQLLCLAGQVLVLRDFSHNAKQDSERSEAESE
jgi:hypothetical protein